MEVKKIAKKKKDWKKTKCKWRDGVKVKAELLKIWEAISNEFKMLSTFKMLNFFCNLHEFFVAFALGNYGCFYSLLSRGFLWIGAEKYFLNKKKWSSVFIQRSYQIFRWNIVYVDENC